MAEYIAQPTFDYGLFIMRFSRRKQYYVKNSQLKHSSEWGRRVGVISEAVELLAAICLVAARINRFCITCCQLVFPPIC